MRISLPAAVLVALPLLASAAPHGLTAADLVSLARLSEPALSPDGRRVVYTLRETDLAADRGRTDLWLLELDGEAAPRRITSDAENDGAADWAADGSGVYFVSSRGGSAQVWFLPLAGGGIFESNRFAQRRRSPACRSRSRAFARLRAETAWSSPWKFFPIAATSNARRSGSRSGARRRRAARPTTGCSCGTGISGTTGESQSCFRSRSTASIARGASPCR